MEVAEDEEAETDESGKPAKKAKGKKAQKKRELVFDENLGQVVAVRKRKRGGKDWGDLGEY